MKQFNFYGVTSLATALLLLPIAAMAHVGIGNTSGFVAGLNHPFSGADHMLAMIAVGILATQLGGKALLALPGAFISMMLVGGILGLYGFPLPYVEAGIAGSLLVLGALIASSLRPSVFISVLLVSLCAIFHGYAHGSEMPMGSGAITYGLGFTFATATLHGIGITLGLSLQRFGFTTHLLRFAGGIIALGGLYLAGF